MAAEDQQDQKTTDKREQMDKLLMEFRAAQQTRASAISAYGEPPRRLHHYTTLNGLLGITSSQSLWASDVRYMNDASEFSYAVDLVSKVVSETFAKVESKVIRQLLPEHSGYANTFEYGHRPFVACFCEVEDLLSQWRGYRSGEVGYSLGMDLSSLSTSGDLPPNTHLRRVIYDPDEQEREVRDVVEVWLRTVETLLDAARDVRPEDVFPYPAFGALEEALAEHHLCFKHPAFAEEREWRLIKLVNVREELHRRDLLRTEAMIRAAHEGVGKAGSAMPDLSGAWRVVSAEGIDIQFRVSPGGLVPYVELPLREPAGPLMDRLPLWQVIHGPTSTPERSLESLRMYLQSCGYGVHTEVRLSNIPLRE